jgi:inward rectifier potassium channel
MAQQINDPGFGVNLGTTGRLVNRDGSSNVKRLGERVHPSDVYHYLLTVSWIKFFGVIVCTYAVVNVVFAFMYYSIADNAIQNIDNTTSLSSVASAFFFSAQTLTTVGYGHLAPTGIVANTIAAVESFIGIILFGFVTGISVGRITRFKPRILYSTDAIIAPHSNGNNALMLRMVNERNSVVMDVEATITLVMQEPGNQHARQYYSLALESHHIRSMPLNWTLVHTITPQSPLWGVTAQYLAERKVEILCIIFAFDDTVRQEFYSRVSYLHYNIIVGKKFERMFHSDEHGNLELHINEIHSTIDAPLHPWVDSQTLQGA